MNGQISLSQLIAFVASLRGLTRAQLVQLSFFVLSVAVPAAMTAHTAGATWEQTVVGAAGMGFWVASHWLHALSQKPTIGRDATLPAPPADVDAQGRTHL